MIPEREEYVGEESVARVALLWVAVTPASGWDSASEYVYITKL